GIVLERQVNPQSRGDFAVPPPQVKRHRVLAAGNRLQHIEVLSLCGLSQDQLRLQLARYLIHYYVSMPIAEKIYRAHLPFERYVRNEEIALVRALHNDLAPSGACNPGRCNVDFGSLGKKEALGKRTFFHGGGNRIVL